MTGRHVAVGALALAALVGACRRTSQPDQTAVPPAATIEQRQSTLTVLSRSGWTASASSTGGTDVASRAIDGTASTRWRTAAAQATNQWFQVDMGARRTFTEIVLDTTGTATEYPRNYKVQVANDNVSWTTVPNVATGMGTTAVTTIAFAPQTAQFIRVTLTAASSGNFWSIHEFNVYGTALSRTGWTATATSTSGTNVANNALDGNTATRWSSAGPQTGQSFKVDMKSPRTFNQIILDAGTTTNNFPRGYAVFVSMDDVNFGSAVATGTGTTAFIVVTFPTQYARYIRIDQTATNSTTWSIQELNVEGQPTSQVAQPRAGWVPTASSTNGTNVASNALDGSSTTRWTSASAQTGQSFRVDMLTPRLFDQITLDAGTSTNNFPRGYQVDISNDAMNWTSVASGSNSSVLLTITLTPARTARHIRINQTATNSNPWSIQEMNVTGPVLSTPGWVASATSNSTGNVPANAIDGSATTRWSTSAAQTNQSFTVDMGTAQVFNQLTLDAGTTPNNFPRAYSVFVSSDGTNWGSAIVTGTGTSQLVTINFANQTARFFRITQTATNSTTWSIQELNVRRIGRCDLVTCTASDQCHVAGVCDENTGICSNPNATNGTTCNDANACTTGETCQTGVCTNGTAVTCTTDQCHDIGACVPATGCPAPTNKTNGMTCNDANACTTGETCQGGVCTNGTTVTCTTDQCHDIGACVPATGCPAPTNKTNGTTCNDGNACTQTDTCQAGACSGGNPVVCTASDQCHDVGVCNMGTGVCSNPAKANGSNCNDGNACTQSDTCQVGACTGANPVVCTPSDQCHDVGVCNTGTGVCSNPAKTNGSNCNDGNACTQSDSCQAGVCTGANPVVCTASDQCHDVGVCNTGTGGCSNPAKTNGSHCNDGNACTQSDTCQSGVCTGANPVTCTAQDQCYVPGTCNPSTGTCSASQLAANGTQCSDGNRCTSGDSCQAGTCLPGPTYTCVAPEEAKYASVIDLGSGQGWSSATGINNGGVVVGMDGTRGFRWSASEGMVYVPGAAANTYAVSINDAGVMAAGTATYSLCRWDPAVDPQPACQPGMGRSSGINADGTVTGWLVTDYFENAPVTSMIRLGAGSLEILPAVPNPGKTVHAVGNWIDGYGTVVGGQAYYGVVRYMAGRGTEVIHDLLPSGSNGNFLYGASFIRSWEIQGVRSSEILGWAGWYDSGRQRAFRIKTNSTGDVTAIDRLPMPSPYLQDAPNISSANASNASGKIVGTVYDPSMSAYEAAFVYTDLVGAINLNDLVDPDSNWTLLSTAGINDHDEVVGVGTHDGAVRAFKLTLPELGPCPPPVNSCHLPGTRNVLTGVCSDPILPNDTACDDGNPCTQFDGCVGGTCQGTQQFTCASPDVCQEAGTCNPAAASPLPPSTQDLIAWWKLDGDGVDATGGGHDLDEGGAVRAAGRVGYGMKFDGSSCMSARIWEDARMQNTSGLTLMAWINPNDPAGCPYPDQYGQRAVMGRGWDYSLGVMCMFPSPGPGVTGAVRRANAQTWGWGGAFGQFPPDQWHHVAITWDHQWTYSYLDGKPYQVVAGPPDNSDWDPQFTIGCMTSYYWSGDEHIKHFKGTVDEAMLYGRALSPQEIWSYYAAADPCPHTHHPDGEACIYSYCSQGDTCSSGICGGGQPVVCTAPDSCHEPGHCVWWAPGCFEAPAKPNGTACNDNQVCTQNETCQAGSCLPPPSPPPVVLNLPVENLGSLGPQSVALDINDFGVAVGWSSPTISQNHASQSTGPGAIVDLAAFWGLGSPSSAQAVNDANTIVGFQTFPDGAHTFRRSNAYGLEDFGIIGDGTFVPNAEYEYVRQAVDNVRGSFPADINNAGSFVGFYTASQRARGYRFTAGGGIEDVGTLPGGEWTFMLGISESDTAVGRASISTNASDTHAVKYDNPIVGLVDLNDLVDPISGWVLRTASSISGDFIVGTGVRNGDGVNRAYRLRISTGVVDDLSGGWMSTEATKVNAVGDTVGRGVVSADDAAATILSGFVFTDHLGLKRLDDLASGSHLPDSSSINARGQIVGHGYTGGAGPTAYRMKLPAGQAATCAARNTCGGDVGGDGVCLYTDGVVETTPGHFVAVFGFDNASSVAVHPTLNEVRLDGNVVTNPQPAPPPDLAAGTHTGAYLPTFDSGHTVSWTVGGETVTASATSPRLQPVVVGNDGVGVVIGGTTIVLIPDSMGPCPPPSSICQNPGTRDAQGVCVYPNKADGTSCSDGNACTRTDVCQAGACVGANPVACVAPDVCHTASCNPATGVCSTTLVAGTCNAGAFDYDKAGRLIRDRTAELHHDGYDQLREVLPIASPPPITNLAVEDLVVPGATQALAGHSNSKGQVPVAGTMPSGAYRTLIFRGPGAPEDLNATLGISTTLYGNSMNDAGAVAGTWQATTGGPARVFRYDQTGFHNLGGPGDSTVAYDINNANQVVGQFTTGTIARGYRHSDATGFEEIGTLGGAQSWGWRVDDLGVVSASAQTPESPAVGVARFGHAALYHDVIGLQDLNTLIDPMGGTTLVIANEKQGEWVVGVAMIGEGQRAYRLNISTGALDDIGWAGWSSASSVNSSGDAVGWAYVDAGNSQQAAWILSERTGFAKLNDLIDPASGWDLRVPAGIDDFGDVVGWGYHNGVVSAFRLRIPAHSSGTGGPMVAEVHTYGYDGLRTSTTTAPGTGSASTQFWFTQDYTERNGVREHYVRLGNRLIARVTTQPTSGGAMGTIGVPSERSRTSTGHDWVGGLLALALLLLAVGGAAFGVAKRRRRWVAALAGSAALLIGAASCGLLERTSTGGGALDWSVAPNLTRFFHVGVSAGPTLITSTTGSLVEERRYEPYGQPIPTVNVVAEPQNILGKLTNPNTGWSYHGARWMQPQTARWTAGDPIGKAPVAIMLFTPWRWHPYQYVTGLPTLLWDPDGLQDAMMSAAPGPSTGWGGFWQGWRDARDTISTNTSGRDDQVFKLREGLGGDNIERGLERISNARDARDWGHGMNEILDGLKKTASLGLLGLMAGQPSAEPGAPQIGGRGTAHAEALRYAEELRATGAPPRAASAAVAPNGEVFRGHSTEIPPDFVPRLRLRQLGASLKRWRVSNCAEMAACNKALSRGFEIEQLELHTVRVKPATDFPRCDNCNETTAGADVTSD
jgi:RHS repeat-associated protein